MVDSHQNDGIEEAEVKKLLQTDLGNVKELDLLDDDDLDLPKFDEDAPAIINRELNQLLQSIPQGEDGLKTLIESKPVRALENRLAKSRDDGPSGTALFTKLTQLTPSERTEQYKQDIEREYIRALRSVEKLYKIIAVGGSCSNSKIRKIVIRFMNVFIKDRCIILNLAGHDTSNKDYLYGHALRVCLQCINLAVACGYSEDQVIEIGEAGLLADVGMLMIPESIRFKKGKLDRNEFFEVQKHPMLGIAALEKVLGMPDTIAYAAYQHHERISGIGYPKSRKGRIIHSYARMVAVADVYQALVAHRSHRARMAAHEAVIFLMKMVKAGILDVEIVKKFIRSVSLFPVGSVVQLSDGRMAKVIQANEENINAPLVSLLSDKKGRWLEPGDIAQLDLSQDGEISISTGMQDNMEIKLMAGF